MWHQMLLGEWTRVKYCIHTMMFSSCSDTKAAGGYRGKYATLSKERSVLNIKAFVAIRLDPAQV